MTVVFETEQYGKIECTRNPDGLGLAYFFKDDYEIGITIDGWIYHFGGGNFRIHWPKSYMKSNEATLEVQTMSRIGTARPQ